MCSKERHWGRFSKKNLSFIFILAAVFTLWMANIATADPIDIETPVEEENNVALISDVSESPYVNVVLDLTEYGNIYIHYDMSKGSVGCQYLKGSDNIDYLTVYPRDTYEDMIRTEGPIGKEMIIHFYPAAGYEVDGVFECSIYNGTLRPVYQELFYNMVMRNRWDFQKEDQHILVKFREAKSSPEEYTVIIPEYDGCFIQTADERTSYRPGEKVNLIVSMDPGKTFRTLNYTYEKKVERTAMQYKTVNVRIEDCSFYMPERNITIVPEITTKIYHVNVRSQPTEAGGVSGGGDYYRAYRYIQEFHYPNYYGFDVIDVEAETAVVIADGYDENRYRFLYWVYSDGSHDYDLTQENYNNVYTIPFRDRNCTVTAVYEDLKYGENTPLWICGEQVTPSHRQGAGWSFDPDNNILTLKNARLTGSYGKNGDDRAVIYSPESNFSFTIRLIGDNSIYAFDQYAIFTKNKNLEITGSGSLTIDNRGSDGMFLNAGNALPEDVYLTVRGAAVTFCSNQHGLRGSQFINSDITFISDSSESIVNVEGPVDIVNSYVSFRARTGMRIRGDIRINGSVVEAENGVEMPFAVDSRNYWLMDDRTFVIEPAGGILGTTASGDSEWRTILEADGTVAARHFLLGSGNSYQIHSESCQGGTVTVDKDKAYPRGTVAITVTADPFYRLTDLSAYSPQGEVILTEGDNPDTAGNYHYTLVMPAGDVTIVPRFTPCQASINIHSSEHGTVTGSIGAYIGETVTLTAKPDAGYSLETLTVTALNGLAVPVQSRGYGEYSFVMPDDVYVTATFTQGGYSIICNTTSITPSKWNASMGDRISLDIPSDQAEKMGTLIVRSNGVDIPTDIGDDSRYFFYMPSGNVYISAGFGDLYTVSFVNWNGAMLQSYDLDFGVMPEYTGEIPTGETIQNYDLIFTGWDREIVPVEGSTVYTATYRAVLKQFNITFLYEDGTVLQTRKFDYGTTPYYTGEEFSKDDSAGGLKYQFSGWSPAPVPTTGDAVYTAVFTPEEILEIGINTISLKKDELIEIAFIPNQTSYYRFNLPQTPEDLSIRVYDGETQIGGGNSYDALAVDFALELEEGKTYTVRFLCYGGDAELKLFLTQTRTYSITVLEDEHGYGIVEGGSTYVGRFVSITPFVYEQYWDDWDVVDYVVTDTNGNVFNMEEGFYMPACDVLVRMIFRQQYPINVQADELIELERVLTENHSWSSDNARSVPGQFVFLSPMCSEEDVQIISVTVTDENGRQICCSPCEDEESGETGYRFVMPATPVTVKITTAPTLGSADFILPEHISQIEGESFESAAMGTVYIPDSCISIGDFAFRNCRNLLQIRIPDDCIIGMDAFEGCEKVYIYGTAGSEAENYCNDPAHSNCIFVTEIPDNQ